MAEQLVWTIFTSWFGTYCLYIYMYVCIYIYMLFFIYAKKLFVSCHYHYVCLAAMVFKVNTANIQYFWLFLDIQIKYSWNSKISLIKHCTLHKIHFAKQYCQTYFFMTTLIRNMVYFSDLLAVKYVNLILRLKVYVRFNDFHNLKILRFMWRKNTLDEKKPSLTILTSLKSQNSLCQP